MPRACTTGALLAVLIAAAAIAATPAAEGPVRVVLEQGQHPDIELWDIQRWREALLALYTARGFEPLWLEGRQLSAAARGLLQQLRAAGERGLRPDDYDANRLAYLAIDLATNPSAAREESALLDVAFSVSAARFVADLHAGRVDPRDAGHDLDVPHAQLDLPAALTELARAGDTAAVLERFEPRLRHRSLLERSLAQYRLLAAAPGLTDLPPLPARSVKPGERYAGAPALRRLLRELGDLQGGSEPAAPLRERLDPELTQALVRFQARHGLQQDGALGRATFRELTTPLERRVRQIELSLERLRWLPPQLDTPPIIVNVPQFRLFAFRTTEDAEQDMLMMDVIVGTDFPAKRTPVFAADMRYVVLRPYWDVPYGILVRELLPLIRADPAWIERNGYEIVRGPGEAATVVAVTAESIERLARGVLRLRQKPGPANALGPIKFMFPNRHSVYLHGTPAQELFARARRDFSHGCIRVADPTVLFRHVMGADPAWSDEQLRAALAGRTPVRIPLPRPIRVYILYATALATEAGRTLFFDDIYGHDARLDALLTARRPQPRSRR